MQFEYMCRVVVDASIDIPDIGNFCLAAHNDMGEVYYMVARTSLGWTEIFEFGPFVVDSDKLPDYCSTAYRKIEYKEKKIASIVDGFLNVPRRFISQAMVVDIDTVKEGVKDLVEYL